MLKYKKWIGGVLIVPLIFLIISAGTVLPQSSTNYKLKKAVLDQGGAASQSTNYKTVDAIGQPSPVGPPSVSTNYKVVSGFFAAAQAIVTETVTIPNTPTGPSSGKVGQSLSFTTGGSTSDQGHTVEYQFDWGDGNQSTWSTTTTLSHSYSSPGAKLVKARARCQTHPGVESGWSVAHSVTISYCTLAITINPTGAGTVAKNPNKANYTYNESVQLTANANSGNTFLNWSGDATGSANPKTISMSGNKNITANFSGGCSGPTHFTFTTTDESYPIVIQAATIEGVSLTSCDEIGVFTPAGLCVGASVWTGTTPLALAAWKDDSQTSGVDGYQAGEAMYFKIWDESASLEYTGVATYNTGDGTFGYSIFSDISLLEGTAGATQNITLNSGWSWISFNVTPPDLNVVNIFSSTTNLQILINGAGQFYIPGLLNGIGNWDVLEGYKINVSANDAVSVTGAVVPYNTPIPLQVNWNFIAYLPQTAIAAETALSTVVANLLIAKQDNGGFYIPGLINTIGNMQPGEGYKLYMSTATTLTYPAGPASTQKNEVTQESALNTVTHFVFNTTGESYSIVLDDAQLDGATLDVNDEIGIFTPDGLCVGASVWTGTGPLGLTAWKDDSQTAETDGYTAGDVMHFRIWDSSMDKAYTATATYAVGNSEFGNGPYSHISLLEASTGTEVASAMTQIPDNFEISQNYPNPFNPETTIKFGLPNAEKVIVEIFNMQGKLITTLSNEQKGAGVHYLKWNALHVPSGLYICRFQAGPYGKTLKLMLVK